MLELTGQATECAAWRALFSPNDVVAIKVNPFGWPNFYSRPATVAEIIRGLNLVGIPNQNIVIYDRYADYLAQVGYDKLLPSGVRFASAVLTTADQTSLQGADPATFVEFEQVDNASDLENTLQEHEWDLVITDHHMVGFSSEGTLNIVRQHDTALPVIIVSGEIGEEVAVRAMHAGAQHLLDHPVVHADGHFIEPENRQRDNDRGRSMAALGGPAVDQPPHEFTQAIRIEGAMLHLILD